jgi:hypothetical protein
VNGPETTWHEACEVDGMYEVRDPNTDDDWQPIDAPDEKAAVKQALRHLDPDDCAAASFPMFVRRSGDTGPGRKVVVRVVRQSSYFEVQA